MHSYSKRKNKRLFGWTMAEIENLDKGVRKLGENWIEILNSYDFHPSRNPNSLRKKYKRLEKERSRKGRGRNKDIHIRAWSEDEIGYLEIGVNRYGTNWKLILDSYPFNNRTVNALSKKWRYEFQRKRDSTRIRRKNGNNTRCNYDAPRRGRGRRKKSEDYHRISDEDDDISIGDEDDSSTRKDRMEDEDENEDTMDRLLFVEKPVEMLSTYTIPNGCISPFQPQKSYSPKLHHYYGVEEFDFMNI